MLTNKNAVEMGFQRYRERLDIPQFGADGFAVYDICVQLSKNGSK